MVFYIVFVGNHFMAEGYSTEYLHAIPAGINHGNTTLLPFAFVFLTLFTHSFLNLSKIAPKHKWIRIIFFAEPYHHCPYRNRTVLPELLFHHDHRVH
jgi:hypothetical protein